MLVAAQSWLEPRARRVIHRDISPGTTPLTCAHIGPRGEDGPAGTKLRPVTPFAEPMPLKRDGAQIGMIIDYSYETPWASGRVEFADPAQADRCEECIEYERWEAEAQDLPEDDAEYDAAC